MAPSSDPFADLGFDLIDPDHLPALLSHSYLTDQDRADPDIVANIRAFDEVFALSDFVAVGDNDEIVGYWRGPNQILLYKAPLIILNSEGTFSLLRGSTISEAILIYWLETHFDQAEVQSRFQKACKSFRAVGIEIAVRDIDAAKVLSARINPTNVHSAAYTRFRRKAGLPGP